MTHRHGTMIDCIGIVMLAIGLGCLAAALAAWMGV